jgi:hypothetical protein
MKSVTSNSPHCAMTIGYKDKYREETVNLKFLGLHLDNYLNLKDHIDQMIPKLSEACYGVRSTFHISHINSLESIYFAYFHSIIQHGIVFWGNSSNSREIFTLQKEIIRIMVGANPRTARTDLFKNPEILPVLRQYIYSLMNFLVNNQDNLQKIHQYAVLIQGISTVFIHQLPTYHAFRKVRSILASEFSTVYHAVSQILRMKRPNLK